MAHHVQFLAAQEALLLEDHAPRDAGGVVAHAHHAPVVHVYLAQDQVADGGRHLWTYAKQNM